MDGKGRKRRRDSTRDQSTSYVRPAEPLEKHQETQRDLGGRQATWPPSQHQRLSPRLFFMDIKGLRDVSPESFRARQPLIRCIPKRFLRVFAGCLVLGVFLLIHLYVTLTPNPNLRQPFQLPTDDDYVVHDKHVSTIIPSTEPLEPFPYTPLESALDREQRPGPDAPWLAAVICAARDVERRMMIRSTWMHLYQDVPFDGRFVVSNPGPEYTDIIRNENRTFGDLIVLDHLVEDDMTANTVKTLELFKWLSQQPRKYQFVSKMDTDLWLNARGFWDRYLVPRLAQYGGGYVATVNNTAIGQLYWSPLHDIVFPHGSMYTVTWDLMELFVALQDKYHVVAGEDLALALLLLNARQRVDMVNMDSAEKFDYEHADSRGDGTPWAREKTHPNAKNHALLNKEALAIHQLKAKTLWMEVASCFDENGIKEMPPPNSAHYHSTSWKLLWYDFWNMWGTVGHYRSRLQEIPSAHWSLEHGSWICDSIWDMGEENPTSGDL